MDIKTKKILASVIVTAVSINAFWAYSVALTSYGKKSVAPVQVYVYKPRPETYEPSIKEYVLNRLTEAFGLEEAISVLPLINCESNWRDDIAIIEPNNTISHGMWQINSIHKNTIAYKDMLDYKLATEWAINKRLNDGSWSAWTCGRKLGI